MGRTADFTIQGFIYQFIVTLQKILLNKDDSEIIVEGIVEDIDIETPDGQEAIQCKYHESKLKFTLSAIYKPVLQMLCHYKKNPLAKIKYILHAHFPNETVGSKKLLNSEELQQILSSKASDLQSYIKELEGFPDANSFLDRFEIEFGASLANTEKAVIVCLSNEGFSSQDAEEIFYPNAIHAIAELSIKHNERERLIKKSLFLQSLKNKKKTAISRWTKELQSYEKLLQTLKKQLSNNFNNNTRVRAILLDADYVKDFENKVPQLIREFIGKYNDKIRLNRCPIFSLICVESKLNAVWTALNEKKIDVERGIIGGMFNAGRFLKEPIKSFKDGIVEFKLRLCNYDDFLQAVEKAELDDIFIISDKDFPFEQTLGNVNVEKITTPEINEIKYLMSLTSTL